MSRGATNDQPMTDFLEYARAAERKTGEARKQENRKWVPDHLPASPIIDPFGRSSSRLSPIPDSAATHLCGSTINRAA